MLRRDADFTIDRFPGRTVADGSTRRLYRDASQCSLLCIHNQFAPLPGAGRRLSGQGTSGGAPSLGFRRANPLTHYSLPAALRNSQAQPASVAAETRSGVFGVPVLDCTGVGRRAPALSAPAGGNVAQPANPSSTFLCRDNFGHHSAQQVAQGLLLGG